MKDLNSSQNHEKENAAQEIKSVYAKMDGELGGVINQDNSIFMLLWMHINTTEIITKLRFLSVLFNASLDFCLKRIWDKYLNDEWAQANISLFYKS